MEILLAVILAGGLLIANVVASFHAVRYSGSSRGQKIAQLVFLWLLPIIGAIFVFLFTREDLETGDGTYRKDQPGWDDMMHPGTLNRKGYLSRSSEIEPHGPPD